MFKDSLNSFYLEFYYLEPSVAKDMRTVIERVDRDKHELGVKVIVPYEEAIKFKAHNRIE